jgi:phosphohistidine phosphatase SixA
MKVAFIRHGAKRQNEENPKLTALGHKMAQQTGQWLQKKLNTAPLIISTPTNRSRQTAEEIAITLGINNEILQQNIPCDWKDFQNYVIDCFKKNQNLCIVMVGHHPTMEMLIAKFRLPIPRHHFSSGVILKMENKDWNCSQYWLGQADF